MVHIKEKSLKSVWWSTGGRRAEKIVAGGDGGRGERRRQVCLEWGSSYCLLVLDPEHVRQFLAERTPWQIRVFLGLCRTWLSRARGHRLSLAPGQAWTLVQTLASWVSTLGQGALWIKNKQKIQNTFWSITICFSLLWFLTFFFFFLDTNMFK